LDIAIIIWQVSRSDGDVVGSNIARQDSPIPVINDPTRGRDANILRTVAAGLNAIFYTLKDLQREQAYGKDDSHPNK
jgi:hypothetical protein